MFYILTSPYCKKERLALFLLLEMRINMVWLKINLEARVSLFRDFIKMTYSFHIEECFVCVCNGQERWAMLKL
jgi:hypothetical protein